MKEFSFLLSNSLLFPIFWVFLQITFVNITLSMLHQSLVFHVCRFYNNTPNTNLPNSPIISIFFYFQCGKHQMKLLVFC